MSKPSTSHYSDELASSSECTKLLVAAIDFGTTYSGWAFSFKHEYESDPTRISSRQWYGGQHVSLKAPTTVLVRPDGRTLEAFGYEAENKYAELAEEKLHEKYYFFKRFKMMLHDKLGLKRDIMLQDDKGLELPAKTVFALAIRYLKDDLKKTCADKLLHGNLDDDEIQWVLTVPAIWNDQAKAFMREAAVEGGIKSANLLVALEPEAASLFCRLVPVQKLVKGASSAGTCLSAFKPGARYMILDAGGGTVDITVHEVKDHGKLKELHKASGGAWGGTKVDEAFKQLLIKIVGSQVMTKLQKQHTDDYLDLFREFEIKKRDIAPDKGSKITLKLSSSLRDLYEEETEVDLKQTVAQTSFSGNMSVIGDKLRIDSSIYKGLFSDAINSIVKHVKELLREPAVQGTEAILMVGGFSESRMLQQAVKDNFPKMKLVIPEEAGLVILKGAVVFGHNPSAIGERVCKYTYGIEMNSTFVESQHDPSKKFEAEGKAYCREIFDKHVEVEQTVKYGEPQAKRNYQPLTASQSNVDFIVYASSKPSPKYVTDFGCTRLGTVSVAVRDMTVPLEQRTIEVDLTFSGTEIEIRAKELRTGHVTNATVNFLG